MPVQFIGAIGSNGGSESRVSDRAVVDKVYLGAFARAHEAAGFDRILIGYFSAAPDGFQIAAYAAQQTERLAILLAHRPGFVAPTLAGRQLATSTPTFLLRALRDEIGRLPDDRSLTSPLRITGFSTLAFEDYQPIIDLQQLAIASAYPTLA